MPADAIDDATSRIPQAMRATHRAELRELLLLGVFYTLMHGGILLVPDAVFWDDWVLYRTSPDTIAEMFADAGAMLNAVTYLHLALLGLGMWSYKVLTFGLWFGSGLLLSRILKRTQLFPDDARLAVVLLFLVLPFNTARVAAIDFPYTLCTFLFFLAWDVMDRRRVTALLLFAASFFTPSLLVFYALPFLDMAHRGGHLATVARTLRLVPDRLDFLLLPFVFFGVRIATFSPKGAYAGYNSSYDLANVPKAMTKQWFDTLDLPLRLDLLLLVILLPFVWLLLDRSGIVQTKDSRVQLWRPLLWVALGVLAFVLGAFPYWILGLVPTFTEWTSRHQLLLPLGTALVLVALAWLLPTRLRGTALSVLVAASLSFGMPMSYAFWIDWKKQRALSELIARDPEIGNATFIVFVDNAAWLNAMGRSYRFYEWNGLMEEAFGTETRFGGKPSDAKAYLVGRYDAMLNAQYKAGQHRRDPQASALLVEINAGPLREIGPGTGIWHWPPLPQLSLRTTRMPPQALEQFLRKT